MPLATSIQNVASCMIISAGVVPHETPIPVIIGRNAERALSSPAEFLPKTGFPLTAPSHSLQIYAITWTPTSHTKDIGTSIMSITAASYIPNSTPPIYPRSPYRTDMLASFGSSLLISCIIISMVMGVLVGWFLIPRCVPNCRTRRQQGLESTASPTRHVALTNSDATMRVELEPLPSRNYGNRSPAVSGINTSGARMRVMESQSQTRKRSRMATENDKQDISRMTVDFSPATSRVSSMSRSSAYSEDDSPLRARSKAVALSGVAMSSQPSLQHSTSSVNKSRQQQLQTIHKYVGMFTPITPTPSGTPPAPRTRTHSLPTPSPSLSKRSSAVLDLPALASAPTSPVCSSFTTASRAQKADRSYTDPTFTRSAKNVPSLASATPPDLSTFRTPK